VSGRLQGVVQQLEVDHDAGMVSTEAGRIMAVCLRRWLNPPHVQVALRRGAVMADSAPFFVEPGSMTF
jgi:hypothetical protein